MMRYPGPAVINEVLEKLNAGYVQILCTLCFLAFGLKVNAQPHFSHSHGFYENPFNLTINRSVPGSEIFYTTDGSVPGILSGTKYTSPLLIDTVTIIRAVEIIDNQAGKIATCTFLFLDDIIHQSNDPAGYPSAWGPYSSISGTAIADYEMDPELMAIPGFADSVKAGLLSLPVISLVTARDNLFSGVKDSLLGGIYIYTGPQVGSTVNGYGYGWERPVSFEYFNAGESLSLQADCVIEIQGGAQRQPEKSPKHSFRLTFRSETGPSKLNHTMFGNDADSVHNSIILRAGFGNTWIHWKHSERAMAQYLRDRWTKDSQMAMGHISSHGFYVNLFINGMYWGIYNPSERMDHDFAESYLGGDNEEYDVIKDYGEVADGYINAWSSMMSLANAGLSTTEAYQKIQGNFANGTPNPNIEPLVDVVSLADYMLLNFYGGNTDWDHHNWVAVRNRENPFKGFRFFCWDGEHMVEGLNANILSENNNNCPSRVFQKLRENKEFVRLFADRVQRHCFNEGALTPSSAAGRWSLRAGQIDQAVNAEAARWGDYRRDVHRWQVSPYELYTRDVHWKPQLNYMLNTYFPGRTDSFISSLRNAGLFPAIDAPVFLLNGNPVRKCEAVKDDMLTMHVTQGTIYYTTDGSDPVVWEPVPVVSPGAELYTGPITLRESTNVKARCLSGGIWSATEEHFFIFPADYKDIKITEVHYHPSDMGIDDNQELEFIELKNTGSSTLNLKGLRFTDGIKFKFIDETPLRPQGFIVLASNSKYFRDRYKFWPYATFDGHLDNSGEQIGLVTIYGDTICSFAYSDGPGWPQSPDGDGNSLVPVGYDPDNDQNSPEFWRASHKSGGSPGADDKLLSGGKTSGLLTVYPNYPNPFTESTILRYKLNAYAHVTISIISEAGKEIVILENRNKAAGSYQVLWNGTGSNNIPAPAGIYYYRISATNQNSSGVVNYKMLKIR